MLGSPSQGRQRGHRKDAVASQIYSDEKITICTNVWLWAGGEAGCVLSHKIQVCNSHPDPVHCWFPLHCTNLWFTWPQRTRQKFQLCWWSRIPPWEKKNYTEKCYFVTVSMGGKNFHDDLFGLTELYSWETMDLTLQSSWWSWGESVLTSWPTNQTFKWDRNTCIFPALEMCSLPASYWALNELFQKAHVKSVMLKHQNSPLKLPPSLYVFSITHIIIKIILKPTQFITPVNLFSSLFCH